MATIFGSVNQGFWVLCNGDGCKFQSRRFVTRKQADDWVEDDDNDYAEYGQFSDRIKRVGEVFHKAGSKLLCVACVEKIIETLRKQ